MEYKYTTAVTVIPFTYFSGTYNIYIFSEIIKKYNCTEYRLFDMVRTSKSPM